MTEDMASVEKKLGDKALGGEKEIRENLNGVNSAKLKSFDYALKNKGVAPRITKPLKQPTVKDSKLSAHNGGEEDEILEKLIRKYTDYARDSTNNKTS